MGPRRHPVMHGLDKASCINDNSLAGQSMSFMAGLPGSLKNLTYYRPKINDFEFLGDFVQILPGVTKNSLHTKCIVDKIEH